MKKLFIGLMLISLLISACGVPEADEDTQTATSRGTESATRQAGSWDVELKVTGGIGGVEQRITVQSGGMMIARDGGEVIAEEQLPRAQLDEIEGMIESVSSEKQEGSLEGGGELEQPCQDCFEYTLTVHQDDEVLTVREDDISLNKSPYGKLIKTVYEIMNKRIMGEE